MVNRYRFHLNVKCATFLFFFKENILFVLNIIYNLFIFYIWMFCTNPTELSPVACNVFCMLRWNYNLFLTRKILNPLK